MKKQNEIICITPFGFQADYIREISNAFARQGKKVILLGSNHHDKNWYDNGVCFYNLRGDDSPNRNIANKIVGIIRYFFRLYKYLLVNNIKYIYDPSVGRPFLIALNYLFLKIYGRKIISTVHNVLPHSKYNLRNKILYRVIYKYLTYKLVVHTVFINDKIKTLFNIPEDKIVLAPHGTYNVTENKSVSKSVAREMFQLKQNEFIVLIFGQLYPYKGIDLFIRHYLNDFDFEFKIIIRGGGDQKYIDMLSSIINSSPHKNKINYEFGYVRHEDVEYYFKSADVVCLPYLEGSQSGVLFMSYAYGRPVLASNVGNFKNDILEGVTGEVFNLNDFKGFKEKIKKIKLNLNAYDEDSIKNFAKNNYSWDSFARIILDQIYSKIADEK